MAKFHAVEFGEGREDEEEEEEKSERASFACGIKIRVPRYIHTVVLRSQTRPCSGPFT